MSALLVARGHDTLDHWAGVENLEERLWPDGSRIDPVVLGVLRGSGSDPTADRDPG